MNNNETIVKSQGNLAIHVIIESNYCKRLLSCPMFWISVAKIYYPSNKFQPYDFIDGRKYEKVSVPFFTSKNKFQHNFFFDISNFETIVKKEIETIIEKIREIDEPVKRVFLYSPAVNKESISMDETVLFKIEKLLEEEFGDIYNPSIAYLASCNEIRKDGKIADYQQTIRKMDNIIDDLLFRLKEAESVEYTATWDSEIGRVFNINVGETYAGVRHKLKTVIKIIKDGDCTIIVFKSDECVYACETIDNFCYQIHLGEEK